MNKMLMPVVALGAIFLTGCQTAQLGTVTPLEDGYIAEASVNNGDIKAAKKIALATAEDKCSKKEQEFYVIEETTEESNSYEVDDTTAGVANFASKLLIGKNAVDQDRTVTLKFDCR